MYDEGEDVTKSVYIAKLEELKKIGGPIEERYIEDQTRGHAVEDLRKTATEYLNFARNAHEGSQFAHISPSEVDVVMKEAEAALAWLGEI